MSNAKKLLSTFLLILFLIAGCYGVIFESYKYGYLYGIVPYVLIFLPFVVLCGLWLDLSGKTRWIEWRKALIMLMALCGIYWALTTVKYQYYNNQLKDHGVPVNALIVGFAKSSTRNTTFHYAVFTYTYNKRDYLQKIRNNDDFFRIGDSINMICSSDDPEIFRILTVKHRYQKILYRFRY
jgi:hypothetical protein